MRLQLATLTLLAALLAAQTAPARSGLAGELTTPGTSSSPAPARLTAAAAEAACGYRSAGGRHFLPLISGAQRGSTARATAGPAAEPAQATATAKLSAALDQGAATDFAAATSFLYTGERPMQTGVQGNTIDPRRAAVLRGRVTNRDGSPLPGVTISVLGHPEYGQTQSRADGGLNFGFCEINPDSPACFRQGYDPDGA